MLDRAQLLIKIEFASITPCNCLIDDDSPKHFHYSIATQLRQQSQ